MCPTSIWAPIGRWCLRPMSPRGLFLGRRFVLGHGCRMSVPGWLWWGWGWPQRMPECWLSILPSLGRSGCSMCCRGWRGNVITYLSILSEFFGFSFSTITPLGRSFSKWAVMGVLLRMYLTNTFCMPGLVACFKAKYNGAALKGCLATVVGCVVIGHDAPDVHGEVYLYGVPPFFQARRMVA